MDYLRWGDGGVRLLDLIGLGCQMYKSFIVDLSFFIEFTGPNNPVKKDYRL